MKALLVALLVGCAPTAMTTTAEHPAHPDAPTGRLAGPPAALRPGVADVSTPVAAPATEHAGHGATSPAVAPPATPEAQTHEQSAEPTPDEKRSSLPKPTQKPRKQTKPPASKQTPGKTSTDKPQPTPPAQQGHEGHH